VNIEPRDLYSLLARPVPVLARQVGRTDLSKTVETVDNDRDMLVDVMTQLMRA
jgi:hypothetical protein